jgi:S-adenosyl-L-methionine hydrolase (adenosine-forming)
LSTITLTTDFGTHDWFVGTMKGVVLGINPRVTLVDLCHEIPSGDIRAGAFALRTSYRFFPAGTVHLVVVDPGVGSARKAIAVKTDRYCFIGPDNGVLSWALAQEKVIAVRELHNRAFFLQPVSRTFHGRDVFAPTAAHVSRGVPLHKLGPVIRDFVRLPWPEVRQDKAHIRGEVAYVDRFGNAITNIDPPELELFGGAQIEVLRGTNRICRMAEFYGAVPPGKAVAVLGSSGFLEIAVNRGNASRELKLQVGTIIVVQKSGSRAR